MVHDPSFLVLDEPFSGLDPTAVGFLSEIIRAHVRAGKNLLFSSHQLDLVEDLCESITLIDQGRVVLHGDVRELKAASADRYLRVDVVVAPMCGPSRLGSSREARPGRFHRRARRNVRPLSSASPQTAASRRPQRAPAKA